MTTASIILYGIVALIYLTATVHYAVEFIRGSKRIVLWDRIERAATLILHALFLVVLGLAYWKIPLVQLSFLSFTAFGVAIVHTMLEGRFRTRGTGVFFFALALVLHVFSWPAVFNHPEPSKLLQNPGWAIHALTALFGYVGFLISAVNGVFYLAVYRSLKSRRLGTFVDRMPPLEILWKMNISAATVGFVFLTLALVLGVALSIRLDVQYLTDAKTVQSVIVWLLYGALIFGHYVMNWQGRFLVGISLACFAVAVLSTALVSGFLTSFHSF